MTETSTAPPGGFSGYQKFVVVVLAFLQFTLVLDFMMVAPLGPLVIPALHITPSQFGLVVSSYAFSAGVSGLLTAGFADRFDRKTLLLFFYGGFMLGTLLCGLASSYAFLLVARMVTGVFAGVVGSVSFAIVTDLFPLQMRGRVMGVIQAAFGASSVLGIPAALVISNRWGWNGPYLMIVALGTAAGIVIRTYLEPVDAHLKLQPDRNPLHHLVHTVTNRDYLLGFMATGLLSIGGFMLMPFATVFNVHNVGLPVERLPLLFLITGLFSFISGPLIGRACDAFGKIRVFIFGCAVTIVMVVIYTNLGPNPFWLLLIVSVVLQIGIFSRIIASSALTSGLPAPADRGSYMSISSSLQQVSGGVASLIAGLVVVQSSSGALQHFEWLGYILVGTTLVTLVLMIRVDRRVTANQRPVPPGAGAVAAD